MNILIKPIITEKATRNAEDLNCFTFVVNPKANKIEIKNAVESAYGVSVTSVRTINVRPDRRVRFTKTGFRLVKRLLLKKQSYRWRKVIQ